MACVGYAARNQLTVHPRGAGTGVAGESLGRGLILDFAHNMKRVLSFDGDTVRVQPGVVLASLNQQLAQHGKRIFVLNQSLLNERVGLVDEVLGCTR